MSLMNSKRKQSNQAKYAGFLACVFAFLLSFALSAPQALADIKTSDTIKGTTIKELGLSSALCPNIAAQYSILLDNDGNVIYARDANTKTHIASITKVMTALVAMEYGDLDNTWITVSETAAAIGESTAELKSGDTMNLRTALKAMMVCSGNDAAQSIAESMGNQIHDALVKDKNNTDVPSDGYSAFVYAMNKKAQELGMNDSKFTNPHGLDYDKYADDMYSTANDVAKMAKAYMSDDYLKSIVANENESITVWRDNQEVSITLESTDQLLGNYSGACGVKTGYTSLAGECFAGAVSKDGKMLISVVLNSTSEESRFTDTKNIWNWYYNNEISYALVHSDEKTSMTQNGQTKTVPVVAYVSHKGWMDKTFKATLENPDQTVELFRLDGNVSQEFTFNDITSDVHAGDVVGTVDFKQNNQVIATANVVAAEDCAGPNFFEGIGIWFNRLICNFSHEPTEAQSVIVNKTPVLLNGGNAAKSS